MKDSKRVSNITRLTLIIATTLPLACTSCSRHDSHYVESSEEDNVYLYNWNDSVAKSDSNDVAKREIGFYVGTDIDENEGYLGGYCPNNLGPEEEDMNFYDGESYLSSGDEVSDEERDEIDEWCGNEE